MGGKGTGAGRGEVGGRGGKSRVGPRSGHHVTWTFPLDSAQIDVAEMDRESLLHTAFRAGGHTVAACSPLS